jgi:hypothetical protein
MRGLAMALSRTPPRAGTAVMFRRGLQQGLLEGERLGIPLSSL